MSNQEIIRRKQYCQTVNEITGSDQYLVVGIDVGKDKHHGFMGTATGKLRRSSLKTAFPKSSMDWSRPAITISHWPGT